MLIMFNLLMFTRVLLKFLLIKLLFGLENIAQTKLNSTILNFLVTGDTLENVIQGFRQTLTFNHVFEETQMFQRAVLQTVLRQSVLIPVRITSSDTQERVVTVKQQISS